MQGPGRDGDPESNGGGWWLQTHRAPAIQVVKPPLSQHILLSVFIYYNLTLNGEKGVCIFICFGKFAWENRAPLFVKLPKCISP